MAGRHRRVRPITGHGRHRIPPRRGHVVLRSLAVAAVLGIGGVSAGAVFGGSGHPAGGATIAPASGRSSVGSTAPVAPAPAASTASKPAVRPVPDFAITVTGHVCWVQVVGPRGRVLYAGLLRHGRTLSYRQRPLQVTLGDAGAVRLVLHHHARPAGRRGQVLRFRYR